ncbi:MAG: stalk domain-containing protein [Bacillota bacterium]
MRFWDKRKSGWLMGFIVLSLILSTLPAAALNPQPEPPMPEDIQVLIDESPLTLEVAPVIIQGRTLVPLRAIFEKLGAAVEWNQGDQTITAKKGDLSLKLRVGSSIAYKNGTEVRLDASPQIISGRTLVPLRFVSEALGAEVTWDGGSRKVNIFSTPGQSAGLPDWVLDGLKLPATDKKFDASAIYRDKLIAKPLDKSIILSSVPPKLDYSQYITLTGSQDSWGGCIGRSIVHSIDIIKEMEHPYSPDFSFWYLHARQDQLLQDGVPDSIVSKTLLENYGLCPESSLPTDYDLAKPITDEKGNPGWDFSPLPQPTAATNAEANLYRVKLFSESATPSVDGVKSLLCKYGPVIAGGLLTLIQGPNPAERHCVTIVGYDDSTAVFKCLNSWGDTWGPNGNGYFTVPYNKLTENFDWVRYFENLPSDRTGTANAYTARISVAMKLAWRNKLTVKIGVLGEQPAVIWDTPCDKVCKDTSNNLCIDVPLPAYAASHWPPSAVNQWYVEITNHGYTDPVDNQGTAEVKEITLARLSKKGDGGFATETYTSDANGILVPGQTTKKIYVPSKEGYTLTLLPESATVSAGQRVTFTGTLSAVSQPSDAEEDAVAALPVAGKQIKIYEFAQAASRTSTGIVPAYEWRQCGAAVTGSDGSYSYSFAPAASGRYVAVFAGEDGKALSTSNNAAITVGSLLLPPVQIMPLFSGLT